MNNQEYNKQEAPSPKGSSGIVFGAFVAIVGIAYLIRALDSDLLPRFLFTWQMVLIILGIIIGIVNKFRGNKWWILLLIGTFFMFFSELEMIMRSFRLEIKRFIFPAFLIILGLVIFYKSRKKVSNQYNYTPPQEPTDTPFQYQSTEDVINNQGNELDVPLLPPASELNSGEEGQAQYEQIKNDWKNNSYQGTNQKSYIQDFIDLTSILGSNERIVMSKKFTGGKVNCVLGGSVLDLHQADFENVVAVEVFCLMGSVDIIIPSNWSVKNEATPVLGSVEDSRRNKNLNEPNKILIIKGVVLLGSIEIKN